MKVIKVDLGPRAYQVLIGNGILSNLKSRLNKLNLGKVAIVVTNPTVMGHYGALLKAMLEGCHLQVYFAEVPDTEESKSAGECIGLIERFAELDKGRGIFVVAFGGGVIGDLAGFCASIYRRGVPYIQIPTTLLAQVDSSIGGKTAIDLGSGKNLIGSFYQPRLVLSDTSLLRSLSLTQVKQALAEIIKYAVISDSTLFRFLQEHLNDILRLKQGKLQHVIEACSKIKAKIVEQDEIDTKGKRIILNFGHTTGHALEQAGAYSSDYAHGLAVATGMLVACEIAKQLNIVSAQTVTKIESLLKQARLPTQIYGLKLSDILKAQKHDKKFIGGKNRFVLPMRIGKVVVKENIPEEIIARAIKARMKPQGSSLVDYE